jgi:TolB-like protein/Tfp pilus assembly protein PilF
VTDAPPERGAAGWWDALRRRKVVQWGLLYVAGAWGFLQGLEYVSDAFQWPPAVRQVALLAALIGLPIALVLAWYHGDRGEQRFRGTEVAIIALLFLVGGGIFWRYDRKHEVAEPDAAQESATAVTPEVALPAPDAKSIAVLPFADMSPQKDQEYMSDGVAEEVLNRLAQVPDLRVIARTSSFVFKGEKKDIAEIAKRLNVAHVLEGSVRKSGSKVRITAQLIRASDSVHLWSETFDRPLDDIFAVQDEIAGAIAGELQLKLAREPHSRRQGDTHNLEAYELYLRGIRADEQTTKASIEAANEYLQKAVILDPNYGKAWAALSVNITNKTDLGLLDTVEGYERARRSAQHALELSPDVAEGYAALAFIHLVYDWDWPAVEAQVKRTLELDPTNVWALIVAGKLYTVLARWEEAQDQYRVALGRDPLDSYLILNLALTAYLEGRFAESERKYRQLLELEPEFLWTRIALSKTLLAQGKPQAALEMARQETDEPTRLVFVPIMLRAAGEHAAADEALQAQIAQWADTGAFYVAQTYAHRGDHDLAIEWLERAYRQKDPALIEITGEPLFNNMAGDPRFKAFLRKMKLPEWPRQTIEAGT